MGGDIRSKYFTDTESTIISTIIFALYIYLIYFIFNWLILDGVWSGDSSACREGNGACVAFLREKIGFILFGVYPREYIYRPIIAILSLVIGWFHFTKKGNWNKTLFIKFILLMVFYILLIRGFGDSFVPSSKWGGLPLTMMLSVIGVGVSYPLGVLLALSRTSHNKTLKYLAIFYIELIRGVPLISILFMSSVLIPLFLPDGVTINKLFRAQIAIILFSAAYFAEVVRGGINSIDKGQWEGARSIGLNYFETVSLIILPQALVKVIPPTVNTMIGMFKDTSLVIIIALFDLMGTTKASMTDGDWLGFSVEAYFLCAVIYYFICSNMGRFSRKIENEFKRRK